MENAMNLTKGLMLSGFKNVSVIHFEKINHIVGSPFDRRVICPELKLDVWFDDEFLLKSGPALLQTLEYKNSGVLELCGPLLLAGYTLEGDTVDCPVSKQFVLDELWKDTRVVAIR